MTKRLPDKTSILTKCLLPVFERTLFSMEALNYYTVDFSVKIPPKTAISGPKTQFSDIDDGDEIFEEKREDFLQRGGGLGG